MKNTCLLFIFFLLGFHSFSQGYGKPVAFKIVETVDSSIKKEVLYLNALEWLSKHFSNANKVIQIADKEAGIILARGNFSYDPPSTILTGGVEHHTVSFLVKFSMKDGKYKLELNDFVEDQLGLITIGDYEDHSLNKKNVQKEWKAAQDETQQNIHNMYVSIKEFMRQNEDW